MISFSRILLSFVLICLCSFPTAAQTHASAERSQFTLSTDSRAPIEVKTFIRTGVRYIRTDDFALCVSARTFANSVLKKVEIILPSIRFKFTSGSPFVIVTRQSDGAQSVYQIFSPIVYEDGVFLLPASDVLALFELQTHQKVILASRESASKTDDESQKQRADRSVPTVQKDVPQRKESKEQKESSPQKESKEQKEFPPQKESIEQKEPSQQISLGSAEADSKYSVTGIDVEEKRNGYLLRIHTREHLPDPEKILQGGQWLYLTIPKARADVSLLGGMFSTGIVKRLIPLQSAQALQLSFQFREKVESAEIVPDQETTDILIALRMSASSDRMPDAAPAREPAKTDANAEKQKNKWKLDVIVLDAGHGGHDPGTIGSMGTHEKDVTLGIALKLGALITKNMPGVKVVYTRKTDNFVELYRRGQIANEAGGKLFISIHCNSTPKKSTAANGFEIYLLRPGKTEDAIGIAEQENSVIRLEKGFESRYQKLTEENFIILTMAQSAFVKQSERFAEILESEMAKKMVYQSRGVKQAGFYVLVGASMPNILVETGYLSNRKDETLLRGLAGQYLAAESIYDGLKKFKTEYESTFSQY